MRKAHAQHSGLAPWARNALRSIMLSVIVDMRAVSFSPSPEAAVCSLSALVGAVVQCLHHRARGG
jgi:hypothetical protein